MLDGPGADAAVRLPEADLVIVTGGGEYDRIAGSDVTARLSLSYAHCHNDLKINQITSNTAYLSRFLALAIPHR